MKRYIKSDKAFRGHNGYTAKTPQGLSQYIKQSDILDEIKTVATTYDEAVDALYDILNEDIKDGFLKIPKDITLFDLVTDNVLETLQYAVKHGVRPSDRYSGFSSRITPSKKDTISIRDWRRKYPQFPADWFGFEYADGTLQYPARKDMGSAPSVSLRHDPRTFIETYYNSAPSIEQLAKDVGGATILIYEYLKDKDALDCVQPIQY